MDQNKQTHTHEIASYWRRVSLRILNGNTGLALWFDALALIMQTGYEVSSLSVPVIMGARSA